jgi:hypothetical protein
MNDYSELTRLAEAATGGRWVTDGEYVNEHGSVLYAYVAHEDSGRIAEALANCLVKTDEQCRANAAFIAAANPVAVLELIAEVKRWKAIAAIQADQKDVALEIANERREERDQLKAENERLQQFEAAYTEWSDKTDWAQETIQGCEWGMHRADVLHKRCRDGALHQQAQADRIKVLMAEVETLHKAAEQQSSAAPGFGEAFYKVAEFAGVTGARPYPPMQVFEDEIVPALAALVKDAGRYRWFREHSLQIVSTARHWVQDLDTEVDVAMAEQAARWSRL